MTPVGVITMVHSYNLHTKPNSEGQIQSLLTLNPGRIFYGLLQNLFGTQALSKCQGSYQAQSPFPQ